MKNYMKNYNIIINLKFNKGEVCTEKYCLYNVHINNNILVMSSNLILKVRDQFNIFCAKFYLSQLVSINQKTCGEVI